MATRNQFKLLNNKCELYFDIVKKELNKEIKINNKSEKARFGFYFYMLEALTNLTDIKELSNIITDKEFNSRFFNIKDDDYGIDAIYIDNEIREVNLFNFKYRESYKDESCQHKNDVFISTKLINALVNEKYDHLQGKTKKFAKEIIDNFSSNDIWKMNLYMVTNENKSKNNTDEDIQQLRDLYDLEIKNIILDDIVNFMSNKPENINSKIVLDKEAILSYTESSLDSSKSYVLKVPVIELIRITCANKDQRMNYSIEDNSLLEDESLDYGLLFDNVRGYLGNTKYNKNIYNTLKKEPSKFFMYNNGITITAKDIIATPINGKKKLIIEINDFQVVNGGQTLRSIYEFKKADSDNMNNYLEDAEVLVKIFKTGENDELKRKIAEYTNSQNAISIIDLKSITTEQIEIEQFLNNKDIIYARKIGDTGIEEKSYKHKISLEKFAQILFSIQGHPDKASNQKKKLFDKYYDQIFLNDDFDINSSADIVEKYYEIKREYEKNPSIESSDQKIFYILYLQNFREKTINEDILDLEKCLKAYEPKTTISLARKLITAGFKKYLDEELINEKKKGNLI
ncbi:AIPR family protein [Clostridium perfringens]|nr:AIPR family protein [Clostridium perfringens]MDM0609997.1 AIPR family protein [Clostridium perfringens]STB11369.1 AIPR protein [Clostridium novyi]